MAVRPCLLRRRRPTWLPQGRQRPRPQRDEARKGGKGKAPKGKGKGQWPDAWAFKDPKKKAFCRLPFDRHLPRQLRPVPRLPGPPRGLGVQRVPGQAHPG